MSEPLHLFDGYGVELEYMLVDAGNLNVLPIADQILSAAAGSAVSDFEDGDIAWSNELALHVIELKTNGPTSSLIGLASRFQESVRRLNQLAGGFGARLMPTAMHPWMDPEAELRLWPHDCKAIYEAYDRIFDCRGHGWANLQSTHINLPFAGDDEFGRLHAAIRLILPLLPGLAASSPIADRRITDYLDYRMETYRHNSQRIPSITGRVIPETVFTQADYDREIYQVAYRDVAPWDPEGVLQHPFLNSRGAIARFDRGAIEIRVLDVQECPLADLAIAEVTARSIELLTRESLAPYSHQKAIEVGPLADLFLEAIRGGESAIIRDANLLAIFGIRGHTATIQEVWSSLLERIAAEFSDAEFSAPAHKCVEKILQHGTLARRILRRVDGDIERLPDVYRELCVCLQEGRLLAIGE